MSPNDDLRAQLFVAAVIFAQAITPMVLVIFAKDF